MFEICMQYGMGLECMEYAWNMYAIWMEYVTDEACRLQGHHGCSVMCRWCVVFAPQHSGHVAVHMYAICTEYVLNMDGIGMEYAWNMFRICMEYAWNMHGMCMEHGWNMHGIHVE